MNKSLWWYPWSVVVILSTIAVIMLTRPAITLGVTIPSKIGDDEQFEVVVTLKNNLGVPVKFDGTIFVFGEGWGKESYPYTFSEGTEVYWVECNTEISLGGCRFWWKGTIPLKGRVSFTLPTFSGQIPGSYPFLEVLIGTSKGPFQEAESLTVTP